MMQLVVVTNNAHKVEEMSRMMGDSTLGICAYGQLFSEHIEVVEDGQSFEENAIKKLQPFSPVKGRVYVAEDSGICVRALDGAPGIYSARYAGKNTSGEAMCQRLLMEMQGKEDRYAHYEAVMAMLFPDGSVHTVSGRCEGEIATEIRGTEGFGYDPVFIPTGYDCSCGELAPAEKDRISHRSKALKGVVQAVLEYAA